MRFCPICGLVMIRDPSSGSVNFRCPCGTEEKGDASDARVGGGVLGAGETAEMYSCLIAKAPYDRVNQLVGRLCPACGLDYMVQIRVGDAEMVIYRCKCSFEGGSDAVGGTVVGGSDDMGSTVVGSTVVGSSDAGLPK